MKSEIDYKYYYGEWTKWMILLIPVAIIVLPFLWVWSIFRGIYGGLKLTWDLVGGKEKREKNFVNTVLSHIPILKSQQP